MRETKRMREIEINRAEQLDGAEMEQDRVGSGGEREGSGNRREVH